MLLRVAQCVLVYAFVAAFLSALDGRLDGDDHFSLWPTAAIERGVPFYDPGTPLLPWLSYLAQQLSGHRTLGEVALGGLLRTLGVMAAYVLMHRLAGHGTAMAGSLGIGLLTLGSTIYGAEKMFLYPVAVLLIWWFLDGTLPAWALGIFAAVAMLFRLDHGLYVGIPMAVAIAARKPAQLATFAGAGALTLAPWLLWTAGQEGLVNYLAARIDISMRLGISEQRPALFAFGTPLWSAANGAQWLWHMVWAAALGGLVSAWRRRDLHLGIMVLATVVAGAGLLRKATQVNEIPTLWVPLLAVLVHRAVMPWAPMAAVSVLAAVLVTDLPREGFQLLLDNGGLIGRPFSALRFHARQDPLAAYAPADVEDERRLLRYFAECLGETDRIWDTTSAFHFAYYSRHPLVDHPYWGLGFRRTEPVQQATLRSLEASPAPVIVVSSGFVDPFEAFRDYPSVRHYVSAHYQKVESPELVEFSRRYAMGLLADRRRQPVRTWDPLGLPCYTAATTGDSLPADAP